MSVSIEVAKVGLYDSDGNDISQKEGNGNFPHGFALSVYK